MPRKHKQFRWYMRGTKNGRTVTLGGFQTEEEAINAGLKLGGYYETKLLPTVSLNEATRMFRAELFEETPADEIDNVFKRFSHKG
jgi:hypothetical protein